MITTNFETLAELALLLSAQGWVIYEYKVTGDNTVNLSILRKEPDGESENG